LLVSCAKFDLIAISRFKTCKYRTFLYLNWLLIWLQVTSRQGFQHHRGKYWDQNQSLQIVRIFIGKCSISWGDGLSPWVSCEGYLPWWFRDYFRSYPSEEPSGWHIRHLLFPQLWASTWFRSFTVFWSWTNNNRYPRLRLWDRGQVYFGLNTRRSLRCYAVIMYRAGTTRIAYSFVRAVGIWFLHSQNKYCTIVRI